MERKSGIDFSNPYVARALTKGIERVRQESFKANNWDALKLAGEFVLFLFKELPDRLFRHISLTLPQFVFKPLKLVKF